MRVPMTADLLARLRERGVECFLQPGVTDIAIDVVLEPPCSLKWMAVEHSLRMGAFSYAVSGYFFGVSFGRYCSVGEQVQIGRHDHTTAWLTTSPAFYHQQPLFSVGAGFSGAAEYAAYRPSVAGAVTEFAVRPTMIGHDVWIGHGAFIRPGVSIGDGAVIGACAVVTRDVPAYAVVAGNPAVVKKYRVPEALIEPLLRSAWWRFAPWQMQGVDMSDPARALEQIMEVTAGQAPYDPGLVSLPQLVTAAAA